jgi:hypothetical protein
MSYTYTLHNIGCKAEPSLFGLMLAHGLGMFFADDGYGNYIEAPIVQLFASTEDLLMQTSAERPQYPLPANII